MRKTTYLEVDMTRMIIILRIKSRIEFRKRPCVDYCGGLDVTP